MIRVCVDSWCLLAELSRIPVSKLGRGRRRAQYDCSTVGGGRGHFPLQLPFPGEHGD